MSEAELCTLTVPQLQQRLEASGLKKKGKKADLVARLLEFEGGEAGETSGGPLQKKSKLSQATKCVETCKPGAKSGCPTRGRGKPASHLACSEVDRLLAAVGVKVGSASLCVKAAIQRGHIKVTGQEADLEQVVLSAEGECGHTIRASLGALLQQPDYAGLDYEDGLQEATVLCSEEGCGEDGEGRTYVTGLCEGRPRFDSGKFHNHCTECPGFGQCIHDYREAHCDRYFGQF